MKLKKFLLYIFSFNLVRITLFTTLLSIIILWASKTLGDNNIDKKYQYAYDYTIDNSDNINIIFLSNSYLFTGFDPLYLESLTGYKSVHLGHHGMGIIYHYINLYNTLKHFKPKLIILDVSSPSFNSLLPNTNHVKYYAKKSLVHSDISLPKIKTMLDLNANEDINFFIESLDPWAATLVNMKEASIHKLFKRKEKNKSTYLGFTPLNNLEHKQDVFWNDFDKTFLKKIKDTTTPFFPKDSLVNNYFKKILDLAEDSKTHLLLVNTIKSYPMRGLDELNAFLLKYNYTSISTLDINTQRKNLNFNKEDFADQSHPNHTGALKQTKFLADYLTNNLPIKQNIKAETRTDKEFSIKSLNYIADKNGGYYTQIRLKSFPLSYRKKSITVTFFSGTEKQSTSFPLSEFKSIQGEFVGTFPNLLPFNNSSVDSIIYDFN